MRWRSTSAVSATSSSGEAVELEMKGYMVAAGEGVGGADPELKASAASTDGALTLIESRTTGGAPPHVHSREDECMYVVEGSITVQCGDDLFPGRTAFLRVPPPRHAALVGRGGR
jgi:mannose-6-phosphate isomerase-like protein (cupin superfamily)